MVHEEVLVTTGHRDFHEGLAPHNHYLIIIRFKMPIQLRHLLRHIHLYYRLLQLIQRLPRSAQLFRLISHFLFQLKQFFIFIQPLHFQLRNLF